MFETLVLLFQLCSVNPCVVIVKGPVTLVTICDKRAVDNEAWQFDKTFVSATGNTILIIKRSNAICSTI